jgi:hypothetical protein
MKPKSSEHLGQGYHSSLQSHAHGSHRKMGKGHGHVGTSTTGRGRRTLGLPFGGGIVSRNEEERDPSRVMSVDFTQHLEDT